MLDSEQSSQHARGDGSGELDHRRRMRIARAMVRQLPSVPGHRRDLDTCSPDALSTKSQVELRKQASVSHAGQGANSCCVGCWAAFCGELGL
ncbi:hypothetical protein GQ55_1G332900 [Panicum hallii var. hallii]|uniref:Uncharacterized protein n=1 Tax=Panicum hallii var. hallii TaxID=1504633 RepID=A0A2T7FA67_9POAL|nr:hypothetical protein GQ55_1G332900 [Panicum hallii var. hallii]